MKYFFLFYGCFFMVIAILTFFYEFTPDKNFTTITMLIASLGFFKGYMEYK